MKKPDTCLMKVEKCEDCRNWEPIPFHHRGGECIPVEIAATVEVFVHISEDAVKVPMKA